jgi:uncharacterized protein (TIGR02145 family)
LLSTVLETFLGGHVITNFKRGTKQYDVVAQVKPSGRPTPAGWHVPSDVEWQTLIDHLGGSSKAGGEIKNTDGLLFGSLCQGLILYCN